MNPLTAFLGWLRAPLMPPTDDDEPLADYLAAARADAAGDPVTLPSNVIVMESPCVNAETRRVMCKHYFGRVGTERVREPRCLNCDKPNPYVTFTTTAVAE